MKKVIYMLTLALSLSTLFTSCFPVDTPEPSQKSSSGAETINVGAQFKIPKNAQGNTVEQQQIMDKNRITSDPTKILWMHQIDMNGRMYMRTPVRSKITSSTKRLEPITCAAGCTTNNSTSMDGYGERTADGQRTPEMIQIDGTYGQSDAYVYWFDPMGHYFQKGDGYLLSDMPIDIENPIDKITGLYRANEAAASWQKEQESKLKK